MIRRFSFLLVAVGLSFPAAFGQTVAEIAKSLEDHNFVVRNYYTDDKLIFDSSGNLASHGTQGFGPTDGLMKSEKVEISGTVLTLTGQRPTYVWDSAHAQYKLMDFGRKAKIVINLPSQQTEDVLRLLSRVFVPPSELQADNCSENDFKVQDSTTLYEKQEASSHSNEPRKVCFPGGERVSFVSKGVQPPKLVHDVDPTFPMLTPNAPHEGKVELAFIVDVSGLPTTMVVTQPLGYGYDERALAAARQWRFTPAISAGKPIPVVINADINFHRQ